MLISLLVISLLVILLVIFSILILINENLLILTGTSYNNKYITTKSKDINIITHDYEHIDLFIILDMISKLRHEKHIFVVDDKWWNRLLDIYIHLYNRNKHIEFLYVVSNTTDKITNHIKNGNKIWIFLYRIKNAKGIYYILKNTNCTSNIIKIKNSICFYEDKPDFCTKGLNIENYNIFTLFFKNIGQNYEILEKEYKYNFDKNISPENFMKNIKSHLY